MMESTKDAKTAREPEIKKVYNLQIIKTKLIQTDDLMTSMTSESPLGAVERAMIACKQLPPESVS